jgi:methyl-accepting chemotaxis protein
MRYVGSYLSIVRGINNMTFNYVNDFTSLLGVLERFGKGDFAADVRQYPGELHEGNTIIDGLRRNLSSISGEINLLAEQASNGELSVRADTSRARGEWLKILVALNKLIESVATPINDANTVLAKVVDGHLSIKMDGQYRGEFDVMKRSINSTIEEFSTIINNVSETLQAVVNNDMTVRITRTFKGDFNKIKDSVNTIIESEGELLQNIAETSRFVNSGAKRIEAASASLAQGVSVQATTVKELTDSLEEIRTQTRANCDDAENADELSKVSISNASDGAEKMKSMLVSIEEIRIASGNIATIIKTIQDIAFQTNMLALNASVEAARAGAHGKGFNVVADEVRNLATRSQKASKETQSLINDAVNKITEGTFLANAASTALSKIVGNVNSVSDIITKIADSSTNQEKLVSDVFRSMNQIEHVVQSNSATSQETATAAIELSSQSEQLDDILQTFKV